MKYKKTIFLSALIIALVFFYYPTNIFGSSPELPQSSTDSSTPRKDNVENRQTIRDNRRNVPGTDVKENLKMRKENVDTRQEIRSERRQKFQDKVIQIKDELKKAVVERLNGKFTALNQRQTARMLERLERLTSIVSRLQERVAQLKANGKNTTSAETALSTAQTAIQTSMDAVKAQASKEYVPQITTESALKQTVGITSRQLHTDLTTTHKTVITAHQAVVKAHQAIIAIIPTIEVTPTSVPITIQPEL